MTTPDETERQVEHDDEEARQYEDEERERDTEEAQPVQGQPVLRNAATAAPQVQGTIPDFGVPAKSEASGRRSGKRNVTTEPGS